VPPCRSSTFLKHRTVARVCPRGELPDFSRVARCASGALIPRAVLYERGGKVDPETRIADARPARRPRPRTAPAPGLARGTPITGAAARVDVRSTVRDALMEIDPTALKAYIQKAVLEGRDVRAITTLLDRVYGDDVVHVEEPHSFDELAKLTREQRRALVTQLEREGRGSPFRAPEH
jgi:hypothetical protein